MPALIVLNGPPAVGKSTMARMYAEAHPLALRVDVDEVRASLGGWRQSPEPAGLRARALAVVMAVDQLRAGHDVVIAQLYGRAGHLDELAAAAEQSGADYHELVLMTDVASTLERFTHRGGPRLEEALASPDGLASIAALHERVEALARTRPHAVVVASTAGDLDATYEAIVEAIARQR